MRRVRVEFVQNRRGRGEEGEEEGEAKYNRKRDNVRDYQEREEESLGQRRASSRKEVRDGRERRICRYQGEGETLEEERKRGEERERREQREEREE